MDALCLASDLSAPTRRIVGVPSLLRLSRHVDNKRNKMKQKILMIMTIAKSNNRVLSNVKLPLKEPIDT
jgi:hypothetical protein